MRNLRIKTAGVAFITSLLLVGCSNSVENADHSQHQKQQPDHSQHQQNESKTLAAAFKTDWSFSKGQPTSQEKVTMSIQVKDQHGQSVQSFDTIHEKKMHLIVVSKDLSTFNHIHPEFKGNGLFEVQHQFPQGGSYILFADFKPTGSNQTVQRYEVNVKGSQTASQKLVPDSSLTKRVDGKEITLSFDGELKANQEVMLTFHLKDIKTKKPITNLQPYLGAVGHVVILDSNVTDYLHVHPADEKSTGPHAMFHTEFPKAGVYKIWGQFQQNGKVFTIPFVVKVS